MKLFKFLKWPILGGAGFLLLCGLIFTGLRVSTSVPSKADCEIYKAVTTEILESEWGYIEVFRPYILPHSNPDLADRISWVSSVTHRTNEKRTVPASGSFDSYEVFITEHVDVDLSSKEWTSTREEKQSLSKCYNPKTRPKMSSLNLNALSIHETIAGQAKIWPNIWQLSEVVKSSDGQSAIIFAESYCGSLCAWSGFYLLEKSGGDWKIIGSHTEMVS